MAVQEIAQGTFGRIYRVKNKLHGKATVIKVLWSLPTPQLIRELIFSTQIAPLHPGFVPVDRVTHASPDKLLLYMPEALYALNDKQALQVMAEKLSPQDMLQVAIQLLDAVAFLHDRGLVHMDIKPSNLLAFALEPGNVHVRLCDYGSIHLQQNIDFRWPLGTREWRSPDSEQDSLADDRDPRWKLSFEADIYALGASLLVLVGTHLFEQCDLTFSKPRKMDGKQARKNKLQFLQKCLLPYQQLPPPPPSSSSCACSSCSCSRCVFARKVKCLEPLLEILPHMVNVDSKRRISARKALSALSSAPLNKLTLPLDRLTDFPRDLKLTAKEQGFLDALRCVEGFGFVSHLESQVASRLKGLVWYWRHLSEAQKKRNHSVSLAQTLAWFSEEMSEFWDYFLTRAISASRDRWICAAHGKPIPPERDFVSVKLADIMTKLIAESGVQDMATSW